MEKIPESWDPLEPDTFSECTFRFLVLRTSMQSDSTCFFRHSQTDAHSNRPGKISRQFACQLGVHRSGIVYIKRYFRILTSSGIWHLFQICNIPILSVPPNWLAKRIDMLNPGNPKRILTAPGRKMLRHFAYHFKAFKCGILQIWKNPRILRSSGIWHFFHICNIPLLKKSAPNRHAKWFNLFHPGIRTQILTAPSRKMLRYFAYLFKALRSGILQIWRKCQNPEVLRNLALYLGLQYFAARCSELACKVNQHAFYWD